MKSVKFVAPERPVGDPCSVHNLNARFAARAKASPPGTCLAIIIYGLYLLPAYCELRMRL